MSDVQVYVSEKGPYFYPDLVVSCDPRDLRSRQAIQYPCLIVELDCGSAVARNRRV